MKFRETELGKCGYAITELTRLCNANHTSRGPGCSTPLIGLINVFTVDPANQHRLLRLLACATDEFVSRAPGFVFSTLHRSLDGTKVTMYAQWRTVEDYEAMRRDSGPLPFWRSR